MSECEGWTEIGIPGGGRTTYEVVQRANRSYGVKVTLPDSHSVMVTGFPTKVDAEVWIKKHQNA